MDENFEDQLSGMMRYRSEPVAPFTAADVVSGARRRSRTRTLGVAGSALAVAAVGVGVVTAVGNGGSGNGTAGATSGTPTVAAATSSSAATTSAAPSTSASPSSSAPAVSPVQHVASGTKIQVIEGYTVTVTKTQKCETETAEFMGAPKTYPDQTVCKDVSSANMAWDGKGNWLSLQSTGFKSLTVISGTFQGPQDPSLIDVVQDGKHYPATIVKVDGMKNWAAYYIAFPDSAHQVMPPASTYTISAYDAAGNLLTQDPPPNWHPNVVTPTK